MLKFGLHVGSYHLYGCNVMSILYVESGPKVMIIYIPQEKKKYCNSSPLYSFCNSPNM